MRWTWAFSASIISAISLGKYKKMKTVVTLSSGMDISLELA